MFLAIQILQSFSSCKRLNFSSVLRSKENKHTMQVNIRNIIELFFFTHKDKVLFIWFKDHTFKRQKKLQEEGNQATAWNPLPPSPSHYSSQENTRREFSSLYSQELEIPIEFRICVSQSGTVLFMDFPLTTPKTCAEGARKAHWYWLNNLEGFFSPIKMRMWLPSLPVFKMPVLQKLYQLWYRKNQFCIVHKLFVIPVAPFENANFQHLVLPLGNTLHSQPQKSRLSSSQVLFPHNVNLKSR